MRVLIEKKIRRNNVIMTSFDRYFNIFSYKILKNDATCLKFGMPLEKHVNYQPKLFKLWKCYW